MTKHTQGRLKMRQGFEDDTKELYVPDSSIKKPFEPTALATVSADDAEGMANARRLAACWNACEGIPTKALEDEAPRSNVTGAYFLQEEDQHLLDRFIETTEDNEGFDIGKEAIKRLANLGVVESLWFGRYGVTIFGYWVHEHYWHQNPSLPLKTNSDRDADARAAIAAAKENK